MKVTEVCPLMAALRKNPKLVKSEIAPKKKVTYKTMKQVLKNKPIGEEAAKTDAWWHTGYKEAKEIDEALKNGTYKFPESDYMEDGSTNLNKFTKWDPYGDDGLI